MIGGGRKGCNVMAPPSSGPLDIRLDFTRMYKHN